MEEDNKHKIETHILKMDLPKDLEEMVNQMRLVIDHFYDALGEDGPAAPLVSFLLSGHGPLHALCHRMAEQWNMPCSKVSGAAIAALGMACRIRESKYVKDHCPSAEPDPDWIKAHTKELSFAWVCCELDQRGLGCNCAFCAACYTASNYEKTGDLVKLMKDVEDIDNDEIDEWKCAQTILEELMEKQGWKHCVGLPGGVIGAPKYGGYGGRL